MRKKLAQITALGLIGGILGGGLVALYEVKGRKSTIWPFPATARVLPGCAEIVLWLVVIVATLSALFVLFATLFAAAGWWTPYDKKNDVKCYLCGGTGRTRGGTGRTRR